MKVLNDHNGDINGLVKLSYEMRKKFRAMIAVLDEDFDYSDFS